MRLSVLLVLGAVCAGMAPNATAAQSDIDPEARVVELRESCARPDSTYLDNCLETTDDLTDWLWVDAGTPGGRSSEPNSLDPVTVRVGPGTFERFLCDGSIVSGMRGFVSVIGSGRAETMFHNDDPTPPPFASSLAREGGVDAVDCTELSFYQLTALGVSTGANWVGSGISLWESVDMVADDGTGGVCSNPFTKVHGWYDSNSVGGEHWFWDARFRAGSCDGLSAAAFVSYGAESWIYASDFLLEVSRVNTFGYANVILAGVSADVRIFGSTIRGKVLPASPSANPPPFTGITATASSSVHIHGSVVNVDGSDSTKGDVYAIESATNGLVHTPGTAFVLKSTTSGKKWRIGGGGASNVQSPFTWPPSDTSPGVESTDGSDMFVKTNAGTGGDESHLYVYDNDCSPEPWRSTVDATCL